MAAIRASVKADVIVPVVDAAIHLPTLGRLVIGRDGAALREDEPETASVVIADGVVTIRAGDSHWEMAVRQTAGQLQAPKFTAGGRLADWQPVRFLRAPGISVALEDTDPYRDCHEWPAKARLTEAEFAQWQGSFKEAWAENRGIIPRMPRPWLRA